MRYASLASGSKGNCHALTDGSQTLLVDTGISFLQIRTRLETLGWNLGHVQAVAFTHEHSDHIAALPVILKRTNWQILATEDTLQAICRIQNIAVPAERWIPLRPGHSTRWEGWDILPFSIPHDAVDPVAYRIEGCGKTIAVVTDLGHPTALVVDHCLDVDILALEANHDIQMLRDGNYPPTLKARILSRIGHLSNEATADLLSRVRSARLQTVVLAHLSEQNNDPALAHFATQEALRGSGIPIHVATQRLPLEVAARL
ncbi:MAG: MBL fold metallo-hydrolase [Holophaga sp.]|nr:MBL fold metallo-hydrolase [Holophaga sp.]